MRVHHLAWLEAHPGRSRAWLKKMMIEGFEIHHVDLDHSNNHPANLVLIDGVDHMRLHGMFKLARPDRHEAIRKASLARWAKISPEERSEHATMMVNARWKKERKRRKAAKARRASEAHKAANAERVGLSNE